MDERDDLVGYASLNQLGAGGKPWWERVPEPVAHVALRIWSLLPELVRRPLIPVGRWINPQQTVTATALDGPESVAGVAELRSEGFEPVEAYTGLVEVALVWPEEHCRSVAETRSSWLDDPKLGGRLWMIRSPWSSLTLDDVFDVLWRWVERDRTQDQVVRSARIIEVLAWDEATVADKHRCVDF